MQSTKTALIEVSKSRFNYKAVFNFDYDHIYLADSISGKKIKKAEIVVDVEEIKDCYEKIILVGADVLKIFTKRSGVDVLQGQVIEDKYIPIINPGMLVYKPALKEQFYKIAEKICDIVNNNKNTFDIFSKYSVNLIDTDDKAKELLSNILADSAANVSVDTETTALYPRDGHVLGICIANNETTGYYILSECMDDTNVEIFRQIMQTKHIIYFNSKFDRSFIEYHFGVTDNGDNFDDAMLMHYTLEENEPQNLKDLSLLYTDLGPYDHALDEYKKEYCRKNKMLQDNFSYDLIPVDIMYKYASIDAIATLKLYNIFKPKLEQNGILNRFYMNFHLRLCKFLQKLENRGVPFDADMLKRYQKDMGDEIFELTEKFFSLPALKAYEEKYGKFNPNSYPQMRKLLFDELGLVSNGNFTDSGADSVDVEQLTFLAEQHEVPKMLMQIRKVMSIKSKYIDKALMNVDGDGRLRTSFNQAATTSGRLSSSGKINMQTAPRDDKRFKNCIKAPEGYKIVSCDLGNAEMWVVAAISEDENLRSVFRNKSDFHSEVAKQIFHLKESVEDIKKLLPKKRQAAKSTSFGVLYGAGTATVAEQAGISQDEAEQVIEAYFARFPKLKLWIDRIHHFIKNNGYIYSALGRKRRLPNATSSNRRVAGDDIRSGTNFTIQSVASDLTLLGTMNMDDYIKSTNMPAEIFMLVHDSAVALVRDDYVDEYKQNMTKFLQQDYGVMIPGCPIVVDFDVGQTYAFEELL
jgi:DNA polymerase I-like protein with 3'-5' exonuclease and polymerase domains